MHLMQSLSFFLACHNSVLFGEFIPGVENGAADAITATVSFCRYRKPDTSRPQPSSNHARPDAAAARLDHSELDRLAGHYFIKGLVNSTYKVYGSAQRRYGAFCRMANVLSVPAAESILCRFVSHLEAENLKLRLTSRESAISILQKERETPNKEVRG